MKKTVSVLCVGQQGAAGLQFLKVNRLGIIKIKEQSQIRELFNMEEDIPSIEGFQFHKSILNKDMTYEMREDGGIFRTIFTLGAGIYMIHCTENGKTYIGRSKDVRRRMNEHSNALIKGTHHNTHLQSAFNKYGPKSFIAIQIESEEDSRRLGKRELFWAKRYKALKEGFNIAPISDKPVDKEYGLEQVGEHNGNAKLTTEQVRRMCMLFNEQTLSIREIAETFDVAVRTASAIRKGFRWKAITEDFLSNEIKQLYWI